MKKNKLKRKSFDDAIHQAYVDFLFCEGIHAQYYAAGGEFHQTDTPNRNPELVPNGIWRRLIFKHINRYYYN